MADYVISQQCRNVHLVYKCSGCNHPVLFSSKIFGAVKVSSSIFNDTTVEEAGKYVMDQLEETIIDCYKNRELLGSCTVTKEELINNLKLINIDPSRNRLDCEIDNFSRGKAWLLMEADVCCPICGKHELWQKEKAAEEDIARLKEENFPRIYHSPALAHLFIKLKLQEKEVYVEQERLIPGVSENAQRKYQKKMQRKQEIEEELQRGLNHNKLDLLTKEIDFLENQLKQLKAFDFKTKKSINQQISEKEKAISEIGQQWKQKEKSLKQELIQTDRDLSDLLILAYGAHGTAEVVLSRSVSAYRLIANAPAVNLDEMTSIGEDDKNNQPVNLGEVADSAEDNPEIPHCIKITGKESVIVAQETVSSDSSVVEIVTDYRNDSCEIAEISALDDRTCESFEQKQELSKEVPDTDFAEAIEKQDKLEDKEQATNERSRENEEEYQNNETCENDIVCFCEKSRKDDPGAEPRKEEENLLVDTNHNCLDAWPDVKSAENEHNAEHNADEILESVESIPATDEETLEEVVSERFAVTMTRRKRMIEPMQLKQQSNWKTPKL